MSRPNDIVGYVIANMLQCSSCVSDSNVDIPEGSEVARWDIEQEDVCSICGAAMHPDASVYVIGNNMAGYLPDSEPFTVIGTFEDAKQALIDELKFQEDYAANEDEAEEFAEAAEDVNLWNSPDSISVVDRVYWISLQ